MTGGGGERQGTMEDYAPFTNAMFVNAIVHQTIKLQDLTFILRFFKDDTFFLKTEEDVEKLKTIFTDVEEAVYHEERRKRYYTVQVKSWPHPKETSLLARIDDPSHWIYTDDSGKPLMKYDQFTLSITLV